MLTRAAVERLAKQARLALTTDEVQSLHADLSEVLERMQVLADLDPYDDTGQGDLAVRLREDAADADPLRRPLADFAPEMADGFFTVPRVLAPHVGPRRDVE